MKNIAGLCLLASMCAAPALAQTPPRMIHLDFHADVQADGSLANVEPDATLAPNLQAMLRKQVAGWRYSPGTWQGKPVPKRISQRIVAEVVQAPGGIFGLRMNTVSGIPVELHAKRARAAAAMLPPAYPQGAQRQGIEATMIYAVRRDAQGDAIEVELVDAQVADQWNRSFDAASRQAIRQWRLPPIEVDGQVIDCRLLTPLTFRLGVGRSPPAPTPATDLRPYLSRFPDSCPLAPVLETPVAGVYL